MSDPLSSRSLLLEQLESRSLLSFGMFSFSHGQDDWHADRRQPVQTHDRYLRDDRPPAEVRDLPRSRFSGQLQHDHDRGQRSVQHRSDRPLSIAIQSPPPLIQPRIDFVSVPDEPASSPRPPSINVVLGIIRIGDAAGPTGNGIELDDDRRPSRAPVSAAATTGPAVDHVMSPSDETHVLTSKQASIAALPATQNQNAAVMHRFFDEPAAAEFNVGDSQFAADPSSIAPAQEAANVNFGTVIVPRSSGASSPQRGMIDSFPLLRNTSPSQTQPSDQQPWELGGDTLRRLRDVAGQSTDEAMRQSDLSTGPTDAAIALWFQGPGGFVEVESQGAPLIADVAPTGMVDIVLDATLGLHRTLDLVASDQPATSGESIRDTILAAIAGEASETAAPVEVPAGNRLSGLAYPTAALLATLAIAKRHRQSNALLATGKNEPDKR